MKEEEEEEVHTCLDCDCEIPDDEEYCYNCVQERKWRYADGVGAKFYGEGRR